MMSVIIIIIIIKASKAFSVLYLNKTLYIGMQVKLAEEHGATGVILYSDPEQVTRAGDDVYPNNLYLPDWAAQRGTVGTQMGDPLTPGLPSIGKNGTLMKTKTKKQLVTSKNKIYSMINPSFWIGKASAFADHWSNTTVETH